MDILDNFFSIIDDKTGLKRVSGRPYGHLHFSPHCIIFLRVKKKSVAAAFSTDSKEKSLPAESHIKWANESGILRKEIQSGGYFKLERGAKNKSKSTLIYELPLDNEQKLLDPDFQAQAIEIIDMLKNDLDGFVTPKSNGRNIQLTDDSDSNEPSISSNSTAENLLEAISDKIMETGILTQYIEDGSLATVSLKIDSSEEGFEIIVIIDCNDRSSGELSDDEDDYICERLDVYFKQKRFWDEFDSVGYSLDDFLGFITEVES